MIQLSEIGKGDGITLRQLLDVDSTVEKVFISSFILDMEWVMRQGQKLFYHTKDHIVFATQNIPEMAQFKQNFERMSLLKVQKTLHLVDVPRFGTFHSKMVLILTEEFARVAIFTANLFEKDWTDHTQGVWVQDFPLKKENFPLKKENFPLKNFPLKTESSDFQVQLQKYLSHVGGPVATWDLSKYNFETDAQIVASVPGTFSDDSFGMHRLKSLLKDVPVSPKTGLQFSSFSAFGKDWLENDFAASCFGPTKLEIVFPSQKCVENSVKGIAGGSCLPAMAVNSRDPQIRPFLCDWKAEKNQRTRHTPHIKTYFGYTEENKVNWLLLTSANLSKSAWGTMKPGGKIMLRSFEIGVFFKTNCEVPFDLPLVPYSSDDQAWATDANFRNFRGKK
jgi:tyrosyl-DNA phosphodiesterase-1